MMNKKSTILSLSFLAIFCMMILATISCKKTKPCNATVTVYDTLGRPIQGALVVLRQDSVVSQQTGVQAHIYDEKISDFEGRTFHEFKWEAVLILEASYGNLRAKDYIILKQSQEVSKEVTLKK